MKYLFSTKNIFYLTYSLNRLALPFETIFLEIIIIYLFSKILFLFYIPSSNFIVYYFFKLIHNWLLCSDHTFSALIQKHFKSVVGFCFIFKWWFRFYKMIFPPKSRCCWPLSPVLQPFINSSIFQHIYCLLTYLLFLIGMLSIKLWWRSFILDVNKF